MNSAKVGKRHSERCSSATAFYLNRSREGAGLVCVQRASLNPVPRIVANSSPGERHKTLVTGDFGTSQTQPALRVNAHLILPPTPLKN
ncbi:MAG TPA: hypothetical protein V6D43_14650 [Candidatus Sericytochromatia bacterium]